MAGHGRAPKLPGTRRRHGSPARGEWETLEPLKKPVLPAAKREWGENAKRAWAAWREDAVSQLWGPADRHLATETCRLYDSLKPNELRLRLDGLGLTPKGRRDLRWRPAEAKPDSAPAAVRRLRLAEQPPKVD